MIAPSHMREDLARELLREVAPGHELFGESVIAIAKCGGCDDAVFSMEGERFVRWARVHLTWSGRQEAAPTPRTVIFSTFAESVRSHAH